MYSDKDLHRQLKKDLAYELEIIMFYLDNLDDLNYSENKKKINKLIIDSVKHAGWVIRGCLELNKNVGKPLKKSILNTALREEEGAQEIYAYQLNKTKNAKIKKLLKDLIKDEDMHARIVRSLK